RVSCGGRRCKNDYLLCCPSDGDDIRRHQRFGVTWLERVYRAQQERNRQIQLGVGGTGCMMVVKSGIAAAFPPITLRASIVACLQLGARSLLAPRRALGTPN